MRYQIVGLVALLLVGGMSVHLFYANDLLARDKLGYVHELNAAMAQNKAEEVKAALESMVSRLVVVAETHGDETLGKDVAERLAQRLVATDRDVLVVEVWDRQAPNAPTLRVTNATALEALGLTEQRLLARERPGLTAPSLERVVAETVVVSNTSLPPEHRLLTLLALIPDGKWVVTADLDADRWTRLFATSELYTAHLVDSGADLLVHGNVGRASSRDAPSDTLVKTALDSSSRHGVHELDADAEPMLGAFADVGVGGLKVVIEIPRNAALAAHMELASKSIAFGLFVFFGTLLAAFFLARRLIAPIRRLQKAVDAVSEGEFDKRVPEDGPAETQQLAQHFNRMCAELEEREQRLQSAHLDQLRQTGLVAAGVAHEINNPLMYVLANVEFFKSTVEASHGLTDDEREYAQEALADMSEGCQRIAGIVKSLQALASSQSQSESHELLDPIGVAAPAVRMAESSIKHQTRVVTDFQPARRVKADASRLSQVVMNLCINAAQAMPEGRGYQDNEVRIATYEIDGESVIEVADNGMGIPPNVLPHIFEPFYTTKEVGKGTGLGLSICHAIVRDMGACIDVDSQLGCGTTFRVRMPGIATVEKVKETKKAPRPAATLPEQGPLILVVDDEEAVRRAFRRALERTGTVTEVAAVREAQDLLTQGRSFDVIFCDVMMPEETGIDLYEWIKGARPELADRFVFVSGGTFTREAQEFRDRCLQPWIDKPVPIQRLQQIAEDMRQRATA